MNLFWMQKLSAEWASIVFNAPAFQTILMIQMIAVGYFDDFILVKSL
jgi:hypothetical protein